eukprot:1218969-Prymnesium_polylepis.1
MARPSSRTRMIMMMPSRMCRSPTSPTLEKNSAIRRDGSENGGSKPPQSPLSSRATCDRLTRAAMSGTSPATAITVDTAILAATAAAAAADTAAEDPMATPGDTRSMCAICLEALDHEATGNSACVTLPCAHIFHAACALSFARSECEGHGRCPLCRAGASGRTDANPRHHPSTTKEGSAGKAPEPTFAESPLSCRQPQPKISVYR